MVAMKDAHSGERMDRYVVGEMVHQSDLGLGGHLDLSLGSRKVQ